LLSELKLLRKEIDNIRLRLYTQGRMDVRIVIATLNSEHLLKACLTSIYENTLRSKFEIVVVDNASADKTVAMIKDNFPGVMLIQNKKNNGVAPARNQGLAAVNAKYVLFLDADTTMANNAVDRLVEFMDNNSQVGICGSKLISPEGELQYTCRRFHNILIPVLRRSTFFGFVRSSRQLQKFLMMDWDHATPRRVDHVIGACQIIRTELLDRIGKLDNRMFYGWEDTDYCVRAKKAGFETWYLPGAIVVHHEQRITKKKLFSRLTFENLKSMVIFFFKNPSGIFGKY